jgi:hypothetical protein
MVSSCYVAGKLGFANAQSRSNVCMDHDSTSSMDGIAELAVELRKLKELTLTEGGNSVHPSPIQLVSPVKKGGRRKRSLLA